MRRYVLWALGIVLGVALSASPAAAQVDVGVWTPNGGGRVVLGAPPVYYPPPAPVYVYPAPVYVDPYYYRPYYRPVPRGYGRGYVNFGRQYYRYPRYYQDRFYRGNAYGRSYYRDDRGYRGYRGGGDRARRRR